MASRTRLSLLVPGLVAVLAACEAPADDTPESAPADLVAGPSLDLSAFDRAVYGGTAKTEGAIVLHEGKIVYERYAAGYDATKRHIAYSVSKTVGAALVGVAIDQGLLSLGDSVCRYVPAPAGADPTYCETTIQHLVQMSSGLRFSESYEDPATSNVLPMLYGDEDDTGLYVARRPRDAAAGARWRYSSGDSNLLARALRAALGDRDMRAWANEHLFRPANLTSAVFESDRSGTLLFSSGLYLTPRDMARFGQLYLDGGVAGSARVLSPGWIAFSRTPAPAVSTPTPHTGDTLETRGGSYGAQLWLNAATPTAPRDTLLYPDAPNETYCAQGYWGQRICMVPSRKLVIVRVGDDRQGFYDIGPAVGAAVLAVDASGGSAR